MPSNHFILCHPLLLLPSIFPSIRVFSIESALHVRWPKYYSFSFSISSSNEYAGLISFRIDWFDFLAVQGTLKHHSLIALILRCSASFLTSTHKYWKKNIALTIWPFVGNVLNVQCQIWYESWLLSQLPSFWLSYLQNQIRFLACIMGGSHNAPGSCPGMKQPWWKVRLTSMGVQAHSSPIFLRQSMKVMAVHLHDL